MSSTIQSNALGFGIAAVVVIVLSVSVLLIARPGGDSGPDLASNPTRTPAVAGESFTPFPTDGAE